MRSSSGGTSGFRRTGETGALCRDGVKHHRRSVPGKSRTRRGHLVEHRAEGEEIGTRIEFFAGGLLGRHVGNRAHGRARTGQRRLVITAEAV